MGIFSRLFEGSKEHSLDEYQSGTLSLDERAIVQTLAELDIDAAIAAHKNWKLRLDNYLAGQSSEDLRPEMICVDNACALGKWIYSGGQETMGKVPFFKMLITWHKRFHLEASSVVSLMQANRKPEAQALLIGSYAHVSDQVIRVLETLKKTKFS